MSMALYIVRFTLQSQLVAMMDQNKFNQMLTFIQEDSYSYPLIQVRIEKGCLERNSRIKRNGLLYFRDKKNEVLQGYLSLNLNILLTIKLKPFLQINLILQYCEV